MIHADVPPGAAVTVGRTMTCYCSRCETELTQYIPPRPSKSTFWRASHRIGETTSTTLHRGLGGGMPRGGAPMLSTFEVASRVEWWAGDGRKDIGRLTGLVAFEVTLALGVFMEWLL